MNSPATYRNVNLRKSHPGLFHSILTVGVMGIALALNFWFARPTFNPYGMDKRIVGTIFGTVGVLQILFLVVFRNLRMTRLLLAASIGWMMFWGLSNTQQFFAGKSSLQLPILFMVVSALQIPLAIESPVNPFTEKR